ncbi:restriction endonuclease subunit S [Marinomonas flavescens]|uniref:restriction endonuclease subunit S n=1 Tax=Marinomonas flavescens TaxID=2529379 RepID=UPI001A9DFEAB|nr:restriction endonuclease subunit S [Marinomonas flavescens]
MASSKISPEQLITDNLDIWTAAIEQKSTAGRGSSKKYSLHGIKKLRELILELAVRGKLVPQDPKDEPASVLLERIAAEKAQLIKDGKIKKQKPLPEIREDEKPCELPEGWEWAFNIELFRLTKGKKPNKLSENNIGYPYLDIEALDRHNILKFTDDEKCPKSSINDIVVVCDGSRSGLVLDGKNGVIGSTLAIINTPSYIQPFIKLFFQQAYQRLNTSMKGAAIPHLDTKALREDILAVPPLPEQHRIVAKVDELMSLCDALEAQTESSISAHQTLVTTLLDALLLPTGDSSSSGDDFQDNWQRISEHFDTLFTTAASIDALKQTILQLAVMGKLVPQDPNDEPAGKLLERIAAEKAQLIKDKKIKKQKPLLEITEDEKPFELPEGWEWCRFEDIVDIQGGITKGRKLAGRELITVPYLSVANVQRSYLNLDFLKEVEIPAEEKEKYRVRKRDLLITEGGDWDKVGRTAIWSDELTYVGHQNHVFKARIFLEEQNEVWLEKYLNGPYARNYFAGSSKQTTNLASINKTQLRGCLIAIPPKKEIAFIMAKVDELMSLCDSLKARLTDAQTTQLHLADTLVKEAL